MKIHYLHLYSASVIQHMLRRSVLRRSVLAVALASSLVSACGGGSSNGSSGATNGSPIPQQGAQQDPQQIDASSCAESIRGTFITTPTLIKNFSSDCDYFISGFLNIQSDLTIEAGTTIVMDKDAGIVINGGRITAVGSTDARITIRGEAPLAGYWNGISFISGRPSRLEHVDIMDGGQQPFTGRGAGLSVGSLAISLIDVSVSNSDAFGLVLGTDTQLTAFANNRLYGNQRAGLSVYPPLIPELDTESDYFGINEPNIEPVVALGFSVTSLGDVTWPALNAPYADSLLTISRNEKLTLDPGAQIAVSDTGISSGFAVSGTLIARGTLDAPIEFKAAPNGSSWPQMEVTLRDANVEFDHVVFKEAENGIVLQGSPRISISNTRFEAIGGYIINCETIFGADIMPTIILGENVAIPDTADGLLNPNCMQ